MNDLIDRQAALDAVFENAEHPHEIYAAIRNLPSAQPTIAPERKKGQWVIDKGGFGFVSIDRLLRTWKEKKDAKSDRYIR